MERKIFTSPVRYPYDIYGCVRPRVGSSAEPAGPPVFGHFPHAERDTLHINAKERIAAEKAILTLDIRNTVLHLYTDSTTLLWYILHWGERAASSTRKCAAYGTYARKGIFT